MLKARQFKFIKNPFNYTGAKFKLLHQIVPLFPKNIHTFVDIFGGSGEVGLNVQSKQLIYNDRCEPLVNIMKHIDKDFITDVKHLIDTYGLNKTAREPYFELRDEYNRFELEDRGRALALYCLLTHSFNYQLAFNSKGEYNMPPGTNRSYFTPQLEERLVNYSARIKEKTIHYFSKDFPDLLSHPIIDNDAFFYADPPYLITVGAYERDYFCKWGEDKEIELLNSLDQKNEIGAKFALSNVLEHKGKSNDILKDWCKKYNVHYLSKDYHNCNYQTKDKSKNSSIEVLVTNY